MFVGKVINGPTGTCRSQPYDLCQKLFLSFVIER